MNRVEGRYKVMAQRQRIRLDEFKRVMRLRVDIDAHDIESGPLIADTRAARAAEEIEQPRFTKGLDSSANKVARKLCDLVDYQTASSFAVFRL
jgi:hypothetical protein